MKQKPYVVRSDVHARRDLADRQLEQVRSGEYAGLFDLGDLEAKHIGVDHPLRAGQTPDENTMDAIVRNAKRDGALTPEGRQAIDDTLESLRSMYEHLGRVVESGIFYRGIIGNAEEAWTKIFGAIGNPEQQRQLERGFAAFDRTMTDAEVEFYDKGRLFVDDELNSPTSAVVYLPWKASMESVRRAIDELDVWDPDKIVILSHDYLTKASIPDEIVDGIRPIKNEEQVVTTLDYVCRREGVEVIGLFGHIGLEYGGFEQQFMHRGTKVKAYHMDERDGGLFKLDLS